MKTSIFLILFLFSIANSAILQVSQVATKPRAIFPPGMSWDIQYSGKLNLTKNVQVYDLDLFETTKATIDALHKRSIKVICYFSAGSY
jgi:hypothetical protein